MKDHLIQHQSSVLITLMSFAANKIQKNLKGRICQHFVLILISMHKNKFILLVQAQVLRS